MGSRGQKVEKATPGGGDGGGGEWSNGLGFRNYDTLGDAIGKKGRPMGMANAVLNANPHYDPNATYKEFTENCQRCVIAYELRRRGYDVTAQPTYQGDRLPSGVTRRDGLRNGRWMGAFQGAKPDKIGDNARALLNKMKEYGEGSRAILQVAWKGGHTGHVVNVEYRHGRVLLFDAQIGKRYNANELFGVVKSGSTQLVRVDHLRISARAKKSVTKDKW